MARIGIFHNRYFPDARGGAEQLVRAVACALRDAGYDIFVVTLAASTSLPDDVDGIPVYRLRTPYAPYGQLCSRSFFARAWWHARESFGVGASREVWQVFDQEKPDIVMTHNMLGFGAATFRVLRRFTNRNSISPSKGSRTSARGTSSRWVHTLHDVQLAVPSGKLSYRFQRAPFWWWLYTAFRRRAIGSPDVVVSPSQWLLEFHVREGFFVQSKTVVSANPVLMNSSEQCEKNGARKEGEPFHFLFVGQLERHKGILFLLDALACMPPPFQGGARGGYVLDIVGTGSLLSEVRRRAAVLNASFSPPARGGVRGGGSISVTVHSSMPHEQLHGFYKQSDVLIAPSLVHENQPTVINEAFACDVPVIAARVGGIQEMVEEGENGWLFTAGDRRSFFEAFQRFLDDRSAARHHRCLASVRGKTVQHYIEKLFYKM